MKQKQKFRDHWWRETAGIHWTGAAAMSLICAVMGAGACVAAYEAPVAFMDGQIGQGILLAWAAGVTAFVACLFGAMARYDWHEAKRCEERAAQNEALWREEAQQEG